jgi:hypothetical protein
MFAFADVFHFFAHKLARLSGSRLAFALVLARAFYCFFFWHNKRITPLERCLAVNNKAAGVIPAALLFQKNRSAAFEIGLGGSHNATQPLSIESPWQAIKTETHNRAHGWSPYQAKSYRACDHVMQVRSAIVWV